jgi:hypothetical protein
MTKTEIELLMTRDVDDVSDVAVHHPPKQLSVTLKNAAALLCREEAKDDIEERLLLFKLLRFIQAALAGAGVRITAEVAREVFASVQLVLKRNIASDMNRAARDVLSVLTSRLPLPEVALLQRTPSLKHYRIPKASKPTLARHAQSSKSQVTRTKAAPKPKRLLPR